MGLDESGISPLVLVDVMSDAGTVVHDVLQEAEPEPATSPRWTLLVAAVIGVLVIATVGIFVANETSSLGTSTTRQVASIREGCDSWSTTIGANGAVQCSDMADWMGQQVSEGHVTGHMMWGDAGAMVGSCTQWADTLPSDSVDGTTPSVWCDRMASWMEGHAGAWSSVMAQGGMKGGS